MSKKGLVLVYDPHNLLQFIWYYCTYAKDKKWDALCLPNGFKGEYMSEYCAKSGIFENIIKDDKEFLNSPLSEQIKLFGGMLGSFLIGRRAAFCKKMADSYVDTDDYDEVVVLTDVGLVSGLFVGLSKSKKVVIMEDGTGDYLERTSKNILKHLFSAVDWKGFILAGMGYANVGHIYPLGTTKDCIKFCSHIDKMPYKDYKDMRQLFDFTATDMELYERITKRVYEKAESCDFESIDTVLFTCNLADFLSDVSEYEKKTVDYVSKNGKNVLLKKHPRDITDYRFADAIGVQELDQSVPAEVILPYIKGKNIIFMQATSVMLYMNPKECDAECLYYSGLHDKSVKESTYFDYNTKDELVSKLRMFNYENIKLTEI